MLKYKNRKSWLHKSPKCNIPHITNLMMIVCLIFYEKAIQYEEYLLAI